MTDPMRLGALAAATGLPRDLSPGTGPVRAADEAALLDLAVSHRILGFLQEAVATSVLSASARFEQQVSEQHRLALRASLANERTAVTTSRLLAERGIASRALKGAAMAHLDYPDPALRTFGDADVLIPRSALPAALACLTAAHHRRQHPPVRGWWERRYGKAVVLFTPDGLELDLHLTLASGYYGLSLIDQELFEAPGEAYELGGVTMTALAPQHRLLHAAYHSVLGGGSGLRALRDVAQLCHRADSTVTDAVNTVAGWRGTAVLATAIRRSWATLALPDDHPAARWANAVSIGQDDERRLGAHRAEVVDGWAAEGRDAAAALRLPDRLAYSAGLA
ncbi:MAG: nucleotidyltransferase family protein, partial [Ilumatobacteraceae bacterium]